MLGKGVFRQQAVNLQTGNETMTIQREQLHTVQLVPITAFDMEGQLNLLRAAPLARVLAAGTWREEAIDLTGPNGKELILAALHQLNTEHSGSLLHTCRTV